MASVNTWSSIGGPHAIGPGRWGYTAPDQGVDHEPARTRPGRTADPVDQVGPDPPVRPPGPAGAARPDLHPAEPRHDQRPVPLDGLRRPALAAARHLRVHRRRGVLGRPTPPRRPAGPGGVTAPRWTLRPEVVLHPARRP